MSEELLAEPIPAAAAEVRHPRGRPRPDVFGPATWRLGRTARPRPAHPLVRVADALGIQTKAGTRAGRFQAAAKSEARVGVLLDVLVREGFSVLHDRWLRGKNVDHVVIGPLGEVTVGDTKWWSARWPLTVRVGRLLHGRRDVTDWLEA
ncbi:hypothetical protein [Streptomyces sp. NPDC047042]|uniref:hypothetical protein n=1 Tax=Streptomyces sp. NPDC047042 TaxID=3154807 RepID=UPI0033C1B280